MSYYDPFQDPTGQKIIKAFSGPQANWRTLSGVARDAHLSEQTVQGYINNNPSIFITSSITASGTVLYGLRDDLREKAKGWFTT